MSPDTFAIFWNVPKCLYFLALSSSNETSSSGCTILEFALDETIFPTGCPTAPRTGPLPGGPPGGGCAWPAANNGRGPGGSLETKYGYAYATDNIELTSWAPWWWWGHIWRWPRWLVGHHIFHHCHHRIRHGITTLKFKYSKVYKNKKNIWKAKLPFVVASSASFVDSFGPSFASSSLDSSLGLIHRHQNLMMNYLSHRRLF